MGVSEPLDAYSTIVAGVAESLRPKVASVRVPKRGGESLGSAVVFTADGFLLTNAHVVGHSPGGTAAFSDGTTTPFQVVGADPLSDLAVLRATGDTPDPAELGEADALVVGQLVVAVGNPLGLAGTVTSGAPLADAHARVVGINTAVAGIGVGLAVPVNTTTRRIVSALMQDGRVRRAYLGVVVVPAPVAPRPGAGSPRSCPTARPTGPGCAPATCCSPRPATRSRLRRTCSV